MTNETARRRLQWIWETSEDFGHLATEVADLHGDGALLEGDDKQTVLTMAKRSITMAELSTSELGGGEADTDYTDDVVRYVWTKLFRTADGDKADENLETCLGRLDKAEDDPARTKLGEILNYKNPNGVISLVKRKVVAPEASRLDRFATNSTLHSLFKSFFEERLFAIAERSQINEAGPVVLTLDCSKDGNWFETMLDGQESAVREYLPKEAQVAHTRLDSIIGHSNLRRCTLKACRLKTESDPKAKAVLMIHAPPDQFEAPTPAAQAPIPAAAFRAARICVLALDAEPTKEGRESFEKATEFLVKQWTKSDLVPDLVPDLLPVLWIRISVSGLEQPVEDLFSTREIEHAALLGLRTSEMLFSAKDLLPGGAWQAARLTKRLYERVKESGASGEALRACKSFCEAIETLQMEKPKLPLVQLLGSWRGGFGLSFERPVSEGGERNYATSVYEVSRALASPIRPKHESSQQGLDKEAGT